MYLDTNVQMEATYAYYFSGTILPTPSVTGTYAYFGLEPSAYLGLRIVGNAQMQYQSQRQKLIDTLAYPGLSIKGIAAVGPTLDLYGQITGKVTLKGELRAGTTVNFGRTEVYWPQDADSSSYQKLIGVDAAPKAQQTGLAPSFDANVRADAQLNLIVTPEVFLQRFSYTYC